MTSEKMQGFVDCSFTKCELDHTALKDCSLKSSDFLQTEIHRKDAHHNKVNRKGGAYGENFFYPARKIPF